MSLDINLRIIAIILLFALHIHWRVSEKGIRGVLDFKKFKIISLFKKSLYSYSQFFLLFQLFGLSIFPISRLNPYIPIIGVVLVFIGVVICIVSRHALGKSWANANDYKTHTNQKLITDGIYRYVRHPIYLGVNLVLTGGEILVSSYLIVLLPLVYLWSYNQAKKEEKLLYKDFGHEYENYKSKTYMFIPYIV